MKKLLVTRYGFLVTVSIPTLKGGKGMSDYFGSNPLYPYFLY